MAEGSSFEDQWKENAAILDYFYLNQVRLC